LLNVRHVGSAERLENTTIRQSFTRIEQEIAFRLQKDGIHYQTQIEIPVTTADFYFATEPRPLIVFVDGRVHLGKTQVSGFVRRFENGDLGRKLARAAKAG
jgi:very-short-patch-repair endonuclease